MKSKKIDIIMGEEEPETERFEKVTEWNKLEMPEIALPISLLLYFIIGVFFGLMAETTKLKYIFLLITIFACLAFLLICFFAGCFRKTYFQKVKVGGKA